MIYFLDIDGTLRETLSGSEFARHPHDYKVMDGVLGAIARIRDSDRIIAVSNQAGVEAGHKSLDFCLEEMVWTLTLLPRIEAILFCPDLAGTQLWVVYGRNVYIKHDKSPYGDLLGTYRKPQAGMLEFVMRALDSREAVMIGNRPEDEGAATSAGIAFIPAESWRLGINSVVCRITEPQQLTILLQ